MPRVSLPSMSIACAKGVPPTAGSSCFEKRASAGRALGFDDAEHIGGDILHDARACSAWPLHQRARFVIRPSQSTRLDHARPISDARVTTTPQQVSAHLPQHDIAPAIIRIAEPKLRKQAHDARRIRARVARLVQHRIQRRKTLQHTLPLRPRREVERASTHEEILHVVSPNPHPNTPLSGSQWANRRGHRAVEARCCVEGTRKSIFEIDSAVALAPETSASSRRVPVTRQRRPSSSTLQNRHAFDADHQGQRGWAEQDLGQDWLRNG